VDLDPFDQDDEAPSQADDGDRWQDVDSELPLEDKPATHDKASERFVTALSNAIKDLSIEGAETVAPSGSSLRSTRSQGKKAGAKVPLRPEHCDIVKKVWDIDPTSLRAYKNETRNRYISSISQPDVDKYLKTASLDEHLSHELQRCGVKLESKKLKHPDKALAPIEMGLKKIEVGGRLGIACAVTQSWLIEHAAHQLSSLGDALKASLSPDDFKALSEKTKFDQIAEALVMAQDAALDTLDIQLRGVAQATSMRRSMWLEQTSWSPAIKGEVKRYPISGDGTFCGPKLKSTLESLRLTAKEVVAAESFSISRKRPFHQDSGRGGPLAKKMAFNRPQILPNFQGGRGRSAYRPSRGGRPYGQPGRGAYSGSKQLNSFKPDAGKSSG
jgi:hypothetical protein